MPLFLPSVPLSGGTISGTLSINGGTVTANAPVLDLSQTWNDGAVTFTGLKLNVTQTAAGGNSLLLDVQRDGVSRFTVIQNGNITVSGNSFLNGAMYLGGASDVILTRGAANTLDLRNGSNAQTWNVYGTYTDASNYRRIRTTMTTGGAVTIAAEGLGTGVSGNTLAFVVNGSSALAFSAAGTATFGVGIILPSVGQFSWTARGLFTSPANSQFLFQENSGTDVDVFLKLGVNTSAAAGIKRVGTELRARLNDDSAFATIQGKLRTDNAYVAGAVVGTGYVTITDSTGTAYRVPVLV